MSNDPSILSSMFRATIALAPALRSTFEGAQASLMTRSLTSWVTLRWFLALGVTVMATKALAAKAKRTRDQQSEGHGEGSDHAPARLPLGERYRRLAAFGKDSFVTKQGIEKLMASVRRDGIPEATSARTQYRARKSVCHTQTNYGPLVKEIVIYVGDEAEELKVAIQSPLPWLCNATYTCPSFAQILRSALVAKPSTPSSPWTIILYLDGVDPSDTKASDHGRHSQVFYWAFMELGMQALSIEAVWGTPLIVRTDVAKKLEGKVSQLMHIVCEQFLGADGYDISKAGVTVKFPTGERTTIFARVACVLGDEPALSEALCFKGHSAHKPCPICMNCSLAKMPVGVVPLHTRSAYAVPITTLKIKEFEQHTNETMAENALRLSIAKAEMIAKDFQVEDTPRPMS